MAITAKMKRAGRHGPGRIGCAGSLCTWWHRALRADTRGEFDARVTRWRWPPAQAQRNEATRPPEPDWSVWIVLADSGGECGGKRARTKQPLECAPWMADRAHANAESLRKAR
jgi:hypothetical protein